MQSRTIGAAAVAVASLSGCVSGDGPDRADDLMATIDERLRAEDGATARLREEPRERRAADAPPAIGPSLTAGEAVRVALRRSPALRRAIYEAEAAAGRAQQAGLHPNPSLELDGEGLGNDAGEAGEIALRARQPFYLDDRVGLARQVGDAEVQAAMAKADEQRFAIAARVERAYAQAVAAEARADRRRELADLAGELLDAAEARVEAGAATETERLRARVARDEAAVALEQARLDAQARRRALATAMGLEGPLDAAFETPLDRLPDVPGREAVLRAALANNASLASARLAIERARRAHELARAVGRPEWSVAAGPRYSDPDDQATVDFGLGVEVPIFDANQGGVRAALAERLSSAAGLRAAQQELIEQVDRAWSALASAEAAASRYRDTLVPTSRRTLEMTREAYDAGKTDYLSVLDAQRAYVRARVAQVDALEAAHTSAATIRGLTQTDAPLADADGAPRRSDDDDS